MKYYRYAKCMGGGKHPNVDLLIGASNLMFITHAEVNVGNELMRDFGEFMQVP